MVTNIVPDMAEELPELSEFEVRFVNEYLIDYNASGAYRRAGGTSAQAGIAAWTLKNKPQVKAAITQLIDDQMAEYGITHAKIMREVADIAFSNVEDFLSPSGREIDLEQASRAQKGAIKKIKYTQRMEGRGEDAVPVEDMELVFHDKLSALTTLMKARGMLAPDTVNLVVNNNNVLKRMSDDELRAQAEALGIPVDVFSDQAPDGE